MLVTPCIRSRLRTVLPAVAMVVAAPGARAWELSSFRSVSRIPVRALGGGPSQCPRFEGEQVRGRRLIRAGGGEGYQDGLAAGDGLALFLPLASPACTPRSGLASCPSCPGTSGLRGRVRPGWCGSPRGRGPPRRTRRRGGDLLPADVVQGLVGAGLVAFDHEDDVAAAGQHPACSDRPGSAARPRSGTPRPGPSRR